MANELDLQQAFSTGSDLDLQAMFAEAPVPFQYSTAAQKENAQLVSPVMGISPLQASLTLGDGPDGVEEAYRKLNEEIGQGFMAQGLQLLESAQSPEETIRVLQDVEANQSRTLDLGDLRENYAQKMLTTEQFDTSTVRGHIRQNLVISEEIQKASQRVWEDASYGDVFKDVGQLIIPFTGYAEEEITKWSVDFASEIERLKATGNRGEARQLINDFVRALKDTQTPIIERNNTLMTLQALDSLAAEFQNGAEGWVDDVVTEEEWRRGVESVVFGGLEVSGIGGVADVIKTIGKRILPTRQTSVPAFVPQTSVDNTFVMTQREGSSVMDTVAEENGLQVIADYRNKGLNQTVQDAGLEPAEASERLMPTMQEYINKTFPDTDPSRTALNELNLADGLGTIKENLAQRLQKDLGEAGVVQVGDVVVRATDNPESLGEFIFHVGDANSSWFVNRADAEAVQSRMFGQDSEIVEVNGKYAVQVTHNHTFNPRTDVSADADTVTGKARLMADTLYTANILDPMRVLGEDMISGVSAVTDVNRSYIGSLAKRFKKATKAWTPAKQGDLSKVLKEAEDRGSYGGVVERRDIDYILQSTSKKYNDSIWESYSELREITEELYRVTDKRFRMSLESQGWKNAKFGEESDFVRPVRSGEAAPNELVFDSTTGRVVRQDEIEDSVDLTLVKAMNPRLGPDGKKYDLVLVRNNDTSALPTGPLLNKQEGYIPRYYTETGWIVIKTDRELINGVTKPIPQITHIVRSRKDAQQAIARAVQRDLDDYRRTLDAASPEEAEALVQAEKVRLEKAYQPQRSRENAERDLIWGNDSDVSFGMGSANSKGKGERLLGSEGLAPVLDPVSAISRRINSIQRDLNHPVIASLQAKFNKMYGSVLKQGEGTAWNSNLESMLAKSDDVTIETKFAMKSMHAYIESMRQVESAPILGFIDKIVAYLLENSFPVASKASPLTNSAAWVKKNAALIFIIGRPLFQIPTNLLQAWAITARTTANNPADIARSIVSAPFILAGRINGFDDATALAKILRIPKSEVKATMDFLFEESGLVKGTDFTDDILSMAYDELTTTAASDLGFYARKYGKGVLASPLKVSSTLQTVSLQMVNMYAFLTELLKQGGTLGKSFKLDAKMKEHLLFTTRKLTQTQNRANQFKYQSSADLDGLLFQFMQHVQKTFLDLTLEPTAVATGISKPIGRNPFAENRKTAVAVTALNLAMFGTSGLIGGEASRYIGNELLEEFPEIATDPQFREVYETLRGGSTNQLIPGFSDRVTPAAFIDSVHSLFMENEGFLDMIFGASGAYTASVFDLGLNLKTVAFTPDMSAEDAFFTSMGEIANLFAGATDIERAYIAYHFGVLPYARNLSGTSAVSTKEAIAAAFSVTPEHILDYYTEMSKRKSSGGTGDMTPTQQRINELFVRQMNRELTDLQASGNYSIQAAIPIRQKWIGYAKAAHGLNNVEMGKVEQFFINRTLSPNSEDFKKFVEPYLYDLDIDETIENLERLANTTENPRLKEYIEVQLTIRKSLRE